MFPRSDHAFMHDLIVVRPRKMVVFVDKFAPKRSNLIKFQPKTAHFMHKMGFFFLVGMKRRDEENGKNQGQVIKYSTIISRKSEIN